MAVDYATLKAALCARNRRIIFHLDLELWAETLRQNSLQLLQRCLINTARAMFILHHVRALRYLL